MTEPDTTPRRGRRARALSPEESAALDETRTAEPAVRGAVAPPSADAPVPTLRKFGRRARIIELSEDPTSTAPGGESATERTTELSGASNAEPTTTPDTTRTAGDRDHDGVELGELAVTDAPEPRPAPRFDGKVLHRPERSGSRPLLWTVWALIAVALIVLVILLLTGVLGPDAASALGAGAPDLFVDHPLLEEPIA
ncbi:hypothetical protein BH708_05015 [Brachybacterium sp. P6-10-X1]|uniref:hypothetical protein n=1 Tax=Brachybacterium sp. P6-10-X1 TaxID=1903186 RepID=UPI000971B8B3|nr:hypothetical protein [Brachybacterium sp. P6-10-X1]APX32190.1 hypothetical protein BH708_05015 [Brachybacterium sp. P6-10-X1]